MLGKVLGATTLGAFVLLSALMQATSPSTIHPLGILAVLILLYVLVLGVLTFFIYGSHQLFSVITAKPIHWEPMKMSAAYYYATVLALAPVMLLGMRSIGRAGAYDIALIIIFELIACFYISKRV